MKTNEEPKNQSNQNLDDLGDRIVKGVQLAVSRMIERAKLLDEEVVFGDGKGNIIKMKARDLK